MTDTAVRTEEQAAAAPLASEALTIGEAGSVSFAELVRIHYEWEQAFQNGRPDPALEDEFRSKLDEFQRCEGILLHAYWSRRRPSAVALTIRARSRFKRWKLKGWRPVRGKFPEEIDPLVDQDAIIRLHRASDWLAREARIADLLHYCDTLGIRVGEILRGTSERIAMQWIFAVQSHLLGFIERHPGKTKPELIDELVKTQSKELVAIENYYDRAAGRTARFVYFTGMMVGAFMSALVAVVLAFAFWLTGWFEGTHVQSLQAFFVSYAAGGIGAIVSVMFRMSEDKFELDYEVGRPTVRRLGSFRPFVGAVFGVVIYFLIASGLPQVDLPADEQAFFYYGTVAFFAGFFERRTSVIFGTAEQTLATSLGHAVNDDDGGGGSGPSGPGGNGSELGPGQRRKTVITEQGPELGRLGEIS
jgi:hypothetical protein